MTIWWFISFGSVAFFAALLFSRNKFLEKPDRNNIRDAALYQPKTISRTIMTFQDDLTDEYPREDIVYGGIRRLAHALTFRLTFINPLAMLIIMIFVGLSTTIYTISISQTLSQLTARDTVINTLDQIAIRS